MERPPFLQSKIPEPSKLEETIPGQDSPQEKGETLEPLMSQGMEQGEAKVSFSFPSSRKYCLARLVQSRGNPHPNQVRPPYSDSHQKKPT